MNSSKVKPVRDRECDELRRAAMFHFTWRPSLEGASFVVGWTKDTGAVSRLVAEHLVRASDSTAFCQIEPAAFYSLGGVSVADDVAQFPQSRFFYSKRDRIAILRADEPQSDRYEYLNAVLDLTENYGKADALYTVNGMAALTPHTAARSIFGVYNDSAVQRRLRQRVPIDMNWQGPPHTSTYLLWLARQRRLQGAGLWVEVPFYLANYEDYESAEVVLSLLAAILGVDLDLSRLHALAADQNERLARLEDDPETAEKIRALEQGESLNRQEQLELVEAAGEVLKGPA